MNRVPENELLSAYLDGELTADERAQVDELLATDPKARQLVEELRAVGSSLKALPAHTIGQDISGEVLRRAQQEVDPERPVPVARQVVREVSAIPWRSRIRRLARPRNFAWSAVAVAVCVLIAVMNLEMSAPPGARSVSRRSATEAEPPAGEPAATPAIQTRDHVTEENFVAAESGAEEAEMPSREFSYFESTHAGDRVDAPKGASPAAHPALSFESRPEPEAQSAPAGPPPSEARFGVAGGTGRGGEDATVDDQRATRARRMARRERLDTGTIGKKTPAADREAWRESRSESMFAYGGRAGEAADVRLVVSCNVTPEAQREQVFEHLLRSEGVAPTAADASVPRREALGTARAPADRPSRQGVDRKAPVVQVDVEATPDQVQAILTSLRSRPEQFSELAYAVEPESLSLLRGPGTNGRAAGEEVEKAMGQTQAGAVLGQTGPAEEEPVAESRRQLLSRTQVDRLLQRADEYAAYGPSVEKPELAEQLRETDPPSKRARSMQEALEAAPPASQPAPEQENPEMPPPERSSLAMPRARAEAMEGLPSSEAMIKTPRVPEASPRSAADPFSLPSEPQKKVEVRTPKLKPSAPAPASGEEMEAVPAEAEAERLDAAAAGRSGDVESKERPRGAGPGRKPAKAAVDVSPRGPAELSDGLARGVARYRVRFVLRLQDGFAGDAASKRAPVASMVEEAAEVEAESSPAPAAEPPPAKP